MALNTPANIEAFLAKLKAQGVDDDQGCIIRSDSPQYAEETKVWSAQRNLKPQVVLKPKTLDDVAIITKLLFQSNLDFAVRNGSVGSASARDVLISLTNFQTVGFDEKAELVTVGAGALWSHVDDYMAQQYPEWAVVTSRTPFVGVVGLLMIGGLSWLSHEYGMISDPENLLDMQFALGDGRLVWGSQEPDLLWAARGGRCAFGVVTRVKLRARRCKTKGIYSGLISYPLDKMHEVSRNVAQQVATIQDPKTAFHAYIVNPKSPFFDSPPGVGVMPFDAHGETHARSEQGFKWMFDIPNMEQKDEEATLYDVNKKTAFASQLMGKLSTFDATGLMSEVDDDLLVRGQNWFQKVLDADEAFAAGSYCLMEFTQEAAFGSVNEPAVTAWPHPGHRHVLQLGVGYTPDNAHLKPLALKLLNEGFQEIPKKPLSKRDFKPTFIEPSVVDTKVMYGDNWQRLESIADKYDPKRRFRSLFNPDPNFA